MIHKDDFLTFIQAELDFLTPPQLLNATEVSNLPKGNVLRIGKSEFYKDNKFICRPFNKHISRIIKYYEI